MVDNVVHSHACKNCKTINTLGGGNVGGHIYDRQRCSRNLESVIPHINYITIFTDGWSVIWFIHMSVKNGKQLQAIWEGGGETHMIRKGVVRSE